MNKEELHELFVNHVDEMTQGERAMGYAAGDEVDYIPFSIQSNEEAMADLFGYTTAQWRNDPNVHIDVIRRRRDEFGIVGLAAGQRLRTVAQAVGTKMFFPEVGIDRVDTPAIQDFDEFGKIADNDPYTNPVYLAVLERGRILKDEFPEMGIGTSVAGPFTVASTIMPIEKLLRGTRKNPEAVRELLDFVREGIRRGSLHHLRPGKLRRHSQPQAIPRVLAACTAKARRRTHQGPGAQAGPAYLRQDEPAVG